MREIKFRAWDKDKNEFVCIDGVSLKGDILDLMMGEDGISNRKRNIDLSQFTGLLDKNGKEIYEGDVLHIVESGDYGGEYYAPVTYLNNWAVFGIVLLDCKEISPSKTNKRVNTMWTRGFLTRSLGSCVQLHEAMNFEVCEVIGNICENPELLKELEPIK